MAFDVALAGPQLEGVENHSLGVLSDAAEKQGESALTVPFSALRDIESATSAILQSGARVVGVSIQSTESALASLSLARVLRMRGFRGHVVCGGHFATLNAEEILSSPAGVDTVVRFAGEEALCGILRLTRQQPGPCDGLSDEWLGLPGIVLRDAAGKVVRGAAGRLVGPRGPASPPRRGPLPRHLGIPAADLVTSHGCEARCAYCCVAAMTRLEERESGAGARTAYGRRELCAIADEVVRLWHDHGARAFNFMDDNLLPLDACDALAWLEGLERELARRGVGRMAFSLQLRADVVSAAVADALVRMGLVRAYVGVDGMSRPMLRALGRRAAHGAAEAGVKRLAERGVFVVYNALLIGPTIRIEDVRAEAASLARVPDAPLHLLPIDVRAGTAYFDRAQRRGLLEGNFLYRKYRFEDPRCERLARVLLAMPTRLEERSVPIALYDLGYNLGVARRLHPDVRSLVDELASTYRRIANAWNADQIRLLDAAIAAACSSEGDAVDRLVARERHRVEQHDRTLIAACDGALRRLEREVRQAGPHTARAHARGHLIGVALSMSLVSCGARTGLLAENVAEGGESRPDASYGQLGFLDAFVSPPPEIEASAPTDAGCATYQDGGVNPPGVPPEAGAICPDGKPAKGEPLDYEQTCTFTNPSERTAQLRFDENGVLVSVESTTPELVDCLRAFLGNACYPSFACTVQTLQTHFWIA